MSRSLPFHWHPKIIQELAAWAVKKNLPLAHLRSLAPPRQGHLHGRLSAWQLGKLDTKNFQVLHRFGIGTCWFHAKRFRPAKSIPDRRGNLRRVWMKEVIKTIGTATRKEIDAIAKISDIPKKRLTAACQDQDMQLFKLRRRTGLGGLKY